MRIAITGASRGIGAELARVYREIGEDVIGTSSRGSGTLVPLDLSAPQPDFTALLAAVGDGPVDLLICNAGVYLDKGHAIETGFAPSDWAKTMAINVAGPFLTVQTLLPMLERAGHAKVAIIASAMGSQARAPGGSYIYRASKAAAVNVARNLSRDLAPRGISVGAYHPGWVRTDMGGSAADISVEQSAAGLVARFADLSSESSGCFQSWDGEDIPF